VTRPGGRPGAERRRAGAWLTAALGAAVLSASCADTSSATAAFHRAGEAADVKAALQRLDRRGTGVANGSGKPRAFLVASGSGGPELIAADLTGPSVLWSQKDAVGARLAVARSAVIYARPDGTLVGRDGESGRALWERPLPAGRRRVGYAADGDALYDVTAPTANPRDVELACHAAASGDVRWRTHLDGEAGAPAARGGVVAVPLRTQFVSLIDGASGRVLADILSREEAALFVRALPEGIFFGSRGVFLASSDTAAGSRKSGGYLEAKLPAFVRPTYDRDMYRPEQADYSAIDRNRILWRVTTDGPKAAFTDGLVVAHSFRFFFGLAAGTGKLLWAYNHPRADAVAAELTRPSGPVVFVSTDGELGALEASSGRRVWGARLPLQGAMVRGATFDAEGFAPSGGGEPAQPLARNLASILFDPDRRFTDVKSYAIAELTSLQGREVTAELLRALEAPDLPPAVVQRAVEALAERRDQASVGLYVEALRVHSDYAEGRHAPRLDVLARAVTATKARQAVPALLEHLRLPDTDPAALRDIADAVLALSAREAVPAFADYLLQYRADPAFQHDPAPLVAASDVLLKLGGAADRATLLFVAHEPRTVDPLRAFLDQALFAADGAAAPSSR
jgi:outer membrane protein assembly factor BamB